jgi:hypothetical protein
MLLRVDDGVLQNFRSFWPASNPIVSDDRHHAASVPTLTTVPKVLVRSLPIPLQRWV